MAAVTIHSDFRPQEEEIYHYFHLFLYYLPWSKGYGFSSGHVWLWELDSKEGRMPKNSCLWIAVLEETPESPLDSKEVKPVDLKEINSKYSLEGLMQKL